MESEQVKRLKCRQVLCQTQLRLCEDRLRMVFSDKAFWQRELKLCENELIGIIEPDLPFKEEVVS